MSSDGAPHRAWCHANILGPGSRADSPLNLAGSIAAQVACEDGSTKSLTLLSQLSEVSVAGGVCLVEETRGGQEKVQSVMRLGTQPALLSGLSGFKTEEVSS